MSSYEYKAWPVEQVIAVIISEQAVGETGVGYVSKDAVYAGVSEALTAGYRWVRTECDMAVFEREKEWGWYPTEAEGEANE